MKISIKHLQDGLHSFKFVESAADCGVAEHPNVTQQVEIDVEVEKKSPHFFIRNAVQTRGRFVCDRCLEEFTLPVKDSTRVVFSSDPDMVALADEEIRPLTKDAAEIDLTSDVRDTLVLALPLKTVCRPECKGLCSRCGANLNKESCRCSPARRDARWAGLDKFLEKS